MYALAYQTPGGRPMTSSDSLRGSRVVVVGAGVIGAAIGYRLAEAGAAVTIVERRAPGFGTSRASFAWLNAFEKPPRAYYDLSVRSMVEHKILADELGGAW